MSKELIKHNKEVLSKLDSTWYCVLIDHFYNHVIIYEKDTSGLDYETCLGEDWEEWFNNDLYHFCEMNEYELEELIELTYFNYVDLREGVNIDD